MTFWLKVEEEEDYETSLLEARSAEIALKKYDFDHYDGGW